MNVGGCVKERPPVKWLNKVDYTSTGESKSVSKRLSVLSGNAGTERAGDASAEASSLRDVPVREQSIGDINRLIDTYHVVVSS